MWWIVLAVVYLCDDMVGVALRCLLVVIVSCVSGVTRAAQAVYLT